MKAIAALRETSPASLDDRVGAAPSSGGLPDNGDGRSGKTVSWGEEGEDAVAASIGLLMRSTSVRDRLHRPLSLRIPMKYIPTWGQPNCPNFCSKSQALALLEKAQGSSTGFRGFSSEELNRLLQHGTFIRPRIGEKVVVAGEPASFFMLVLSGAVEVVNALESSAGNKILIQKGELLGDLALLMASRPMTALRFVHQLRLVRCGFYGVCVQGGTRMATCRVAQAGTVLVRRLCTKP
jgi:hypothetical protein